MIYKKFYIVIISYLAAMLLISSVFAYSLGRDISYSFVSLGAIVIITISFGFWLNTTNRKLAFFFSAVRNDETSLYFPENIGFADEKKLNQSLNDLNEKLKNAKLSIELQEKFYKSVMENIRTGIISFYSNGVVEYANPEILRMFNLERITHIDKLNSIDPKLGEMLLKLNTGENKRINVKVDHNLMSLAVHSQTIVMQGKEIKIATFQDIKSELDKQETDSWQKLIRILNHEIMNSVAPITSLSSTLSSYYKSGEDQTDRNLITSKIISDTIRGLGIIEEHGKGLIKFVESYRSLTQLPKPEFTRINIREFLERVTILSNSYLDSENFKEENRPTIMTEVKPEGLTMMADDKLLAQVFINIVKNSAEAFDIHRTDNKIVINVFRDPDGKITMTVNDNGPGMEADVLEKIFIPFFTTKESGSGIGLSLSRQIMRLHNGNIMCDSIPGEGSTFTLTF
jgi:two-component system nitrogen regulation sensor histidine kinase NtrY